MASRLDRLVTLLETGSTQLIRNTAAQQLADIQKKHPDDLFNLLTRVVPYLKQKQWDTRIAAAKALGGIVDHAPQFDPNEPDSIAKSDKLDPESAVKKGEPIIKPEDSPPADDQLHLDTLDVNAILTHGKKLLGSAGKEYEYYLNSMDPAQRLDHQKKSLSSRLGLGGEYTDDALIDESDIVKPHLTLPPKSPGKLSRLDTKLDRHDTSMSGIEPPTPLSTKTPVGDEGGLSKRQLNMLKRKNKKEFKSQANKVRVVDLSRRRSSFNEESTLNGHSKPDPVAVKQEPTIDEEEEDKKPDDYFSLERKNADDDSKLVSEYKGPEAPIKSDLLPEEEEEGKEWPFERLCEYMMVDLFDYKWEIRHGAAMGLREVLRVHGAGAGRHKDKTQPLNDLLNQRWLDDLACRLCCVFMLDRFGDYISDNVVAPIRETAGQALGALLKYMTPTSVKAVYHILETLVLQDNVGLGKKAWQACHGGMIGIRYLVAVRHDVLLADKGIMDRLLSVIMKGLADHDDDVRTVSAATLIPVADEFIRLRPTALSELVHIVWDCLSNLSDDLSASTGSVMDLLAKLCSFPEVLDVMKANAEKDAEQTFSQLVPRLFPFLRHTITGVRLAVLRALLTFMDIKGEGTLGWIDGRALRLVFQNLLLERNAGVQDLSLKVWSSMLEAAYSQDKNGLVSEMTAHIAPILNLTLHPIGVSRHPIPMDTDNIIKPSGQTLVLPTYTGKRSSPRPTPTKGDAAGRGRRKAGKDSDAVHTPSSAHNIDGPMINGDLDLVGAATMVRSKIVSSQALGRLIKSWPEAGRVDTFSAALSTALASDFSTTQSTASMVIEEYSKLCSTRDDFALTFAAALSKLVQDDAPTHYADLVNFLKIVQSQCHALVHTFHTTGHIRSEHLPTVAPKVQGEESAGAYAFSLHDAERIVKDDFDKLKKSMTPANRILATSALNEHQSDAIRAIDELKLVKSQRDVQIKAAASSAIVAMRNIPKKASSTIKGLMDSVKTEENIDLQKRSAAAVVSLIQQMNSAGKIGVAERVVTNLSKFYCVDTAETPEFHPNKGVHDGILSLRKDEDIRAHANQEKHDRDVKAAKITRRGAREALEVLAVEYGKDLFTSVPILQKLVQQPLQEAFANELPKSIEDESSNLGQDAVDGLSTLRAIVGKVDPDLHAQVLTLIPLITNALKCRLSVLRYMAAKCIATICSVMPVDGFNMLVKQVLPSMSNALELSQRQGAVECVYHLIHVMEDAILPYVIFLIVPVLGRMSDSDNDVRLIATTTFATLVKLVPLEAGIPDPPGMSEDMLKGRERERKFMSQRLDPKNIENFEIPVGIKAQLRSYQQDGVNWLAFLNRYHLHGILCDDMGLGKTLQTICMVASDHFMRAEEFKKTQNPDMRPLPTLIVCPATLSGHWKQEIQTYAPFLNPVSFVGPPAERNRVKPDMDNADVIITSYEICRNAIEDLAPRAYNYCVLDEGHLIKNPAAKTTMAVKRLKCYHRLILSGTPIQNNVLELWSLFDFLMPGFLGTEKVFKDRFAKPILASRNAKSSSREQEAGALAIEGLHKQVLPFLLRRLKEEVLDDLPPKILQNYYCDLSDLQRKLFDDFVKKESKQIQSLATDDSNKEAKQHIFTALNYMRKLCNSPSLVMNEKHKGWPAIQSWLAARKTTLHDPVHAPKLGALRDLLVDCGVGAADVTPATGKETSEEKALAAAGDAVSQHRVLIFCQMKEMLDIVQNEVLRRMLPSVSFLRLDGSVEATRRQDIVNTFNRDPSIDVLLLTTSVGGLGLNLTGADTVVFVEHDWNPQKDIQAADRAHRIGQKKTVNVHRLISRGTLEEKILSLQRFKVDVASQVVKQQKAGLASMDTGEILDLFNTSAGEAAAVVEPAADETEGAVDVTGEVNTDRKKGFLDELGELWDERQYEDEYNLDDFLSKMKG